MIIHKMDKDSEPGKKRPLCRHGYKTMLSYNWKPVTCKKCLKYKAKEKKND